MQIYPRSMFPRLKEALVDKRIVVITGMRRVGKTTTLRWLLDQVSTENKIYLDLERLDQRAVFQESNYDLVLNYLRNRGLDPDQPMTVALDEIQYAPNLPSVIKYLYDNQRIKFLVTGSSSFYLKNYFSESLAGRKIIFELFPLGFGEYLDFRGIPFRQRTELADMLYDPPEFERLKGFYEEFLNYGGLPDVALESRPQIKREILQDIYSSYINIDVKTMADFHKVGDLQRLLQVLALRIGNRLDISKLSQIIGVSRPTLMEYLDFLEKTYIIFRLPAFAGPDRASALGKKLYLCDNGIATILAQVGEGALFENAIFNQLRNYGQLAYLSYGNRYEVDFIMTQEGEPPVGLEVKYHPLLVDVQRLSGLAQKHDLAQAWLVGRYASPGFQNFIWGGHIF